MNFIDSVIENIILPIYGITFLVAMWRFSKYHTTHLKYLPILILYTLLNELLALIVRINPELFSLSINNLYTNYNVIIYNIYNIVYFLYFFQLFRKSIENKAHEKWVLFGIYTFLFLCIVNPFLQNIFEASQLISYTFGSIFLIIIVLRYLKEVNWKLNTFHPNSSILFWLGIGILIFSLGYLPIKLSIHFYQGFSMETYIWLRRIHLSLIFLMYCCFIIGFIKMKKNLTMRN